MMILTLSLDRKIIDLLMIIQRPWWPKCLRSPGSQVKDTGGETREISPVMA